MVTLGGQALIDEVETFHDWLVVVQRKDVIRDLKAMNWCSC